MIRSLSLCLALVWMAGAAAAGQTRCWVENGALVVPAAFGDIAGDFILDLAASRSEINVTQAQAHEIEAPVGRRVLILAGERRDAFAMAVADLDARSAGFPTTINGVLGADALAGLVVDIDFTPCRITLHRGPRRPLAGSMKLPLRRLAGLPAVWASISDGAANRSGWFLLDTASAETRVTDAKLSRTAPPGGDTTARLRALSLGGRLFEQTPAAPMADAPAGVEGAIGGAIWRHFHLRLDIKRGWLDLAPMDDPKRSLRPRGGGVIQRGSAGPLGCLTPSPAARSDSAEARRLQTKFAMRTKANMFEGFGVGLAVDENEIGFQMAIAVIGPPAG